MDFPSESFTRRLICGVAVCVLAFIPVCIGWGCLWENVCVYLGVGNWIGGGDAPLFMYVICQVPTVAYLIGGVVSLAIGINKRHWWPIIVGLLSLMVSAVVGWYMWFAVGMMATG